MNESMCRRLVYARAGDRCEVQIRGVCLGEPTEYQHRRARSHCSREELWLPSNGLRVCGWGNATGCHGYIHQNPLEAVANGWTVKSGITPPIEVPVRLAVGVVMLDDVGGYTPALALDGAS